MAWVLLYPRHNSAVAKKTIAWSHAVMQARSLHASERQVQLPHHWCSEPGCSQFFPGLAALKLPLALVILRPFHFAPGTERQALTQNRAVMQHSLVTRPLGTKCMNVKILAASKSHLEDVLVHFKTHTKMLGRWAWVAGGGGGLKGCQGSGGRVLDGS